MQREIDLLDSGVKEAKLAGRLDLKGAEEISDQFTFQLASSKAPVLVNMAGVEFLASIGIRTLLSTARSLERRGGKLVLLQPTEFVKDVLTTAGVDQLLDIYDDRQAALDALQAAVVD